MQKIFKQCLQLQKRLGYDINNMTDSEREDLGCQYALALMVEAGELVQTLPWKPWKKGDINKTKTLDELADVLIFAGDLSLCLGFTAEEVEDAIETKIRKVVKRQNYGKGENE